MLQGKARDIDPENINTFHILRTHVLMLSSKGPREGGPAAGKCPRQAANAGVIGQLNIAPLV